MWGKRPLRIRYDAASNAAYLYLLDPVPKGKFVAHTVSLDPREIDGMINIDFDDQGRMVGIEVLEARRFLTDAVIERAEKT